MKTGLSVVVPAYNEQDNLKSSVESVYQVLKALKFDWEIIIVNDGSKDKTGQVARSLQKKIPNVKLVEHFPNRGYGGSLRAGFAAATKDFVTLAHADSQFDFSEITSLFSKMQETEADIVSGIRVHDSDPLLRRINRWLWNKLVYALFGHLATDIDCGFKLFKRSVFSQINLTSNGALIDTQLFAAARARGLKISEVPVTHLSRKSGKSTGANPKVIVKALREILVFWWNLKQELMLEQGRAVFRWEVISIFCILLLASFLRLHKINQYQTFLGDEGRDVAVVMDMLLGRKFTLIGPGTSIGNMYLGPLYYYLLLIPLTLSNFSPVGPAIMVAFFGVATVFLLWWIARQWFNRGSALLISILYSLSPTIITYSRSSWNPNIMPFFALVTMYGIWKVWRFGYWRWLVISAISFAFVLQSHYLGLLLLPVIAIFWLLSLTRHSQTANRHTLIAICLFAILMSPLLWFDMRHGWINFSAMAHFFTDRQTTVNIKAYKALPNLWPVWLDINSSLLTARDKILAIFTSLGLLSSLFIYYKSRSKDLLFTLAWIIGGLIGLGLYKQHIYDHYYGFLFPAVFLLLGFVISKARYITAPLLIALFWVNISANPLRYAPNNQLLHTREVASFISNQAGSKSFNLALIAKRNYDMGYRYFLDIDQAQYRTIHQQLTDQLFVICEDPVCDPIGNPLWEIAAFGWAKIDRTWEFPWGVKVFKLIHNPTGKPS